MCSSLCVPLLFIVQQKYYKLIFAGYFVGLSTQVESHKQLHVTWQTSCLPSGILKLLLTVHKDCCLHSSKKILHHFLSVRKFTPAASGSADVTLQQESLIILVEQVLFCNVKAPDKTIYSQNSSAFFVFSSVFPMCAQRYQLACTVSIDVTQHGATKVSPPSLKEKFWHTSNFNTITVCIFQDLIFPSS